MRMLLGQPLIEYTFDHGLACQRLTGLLLTSDCEAAKELAHRRGLEVVDRPAHLATDTATVDAAARHAVQAWEDRHGSAVGMAVLLYGNIPLRRPGLIDRAIERCMTTGADSVRSVARVSKQHPDWLHRLEGDRMIQYRPNSIYRRQDLEPLYYHDGAVVVVTRRALFEALRYPNDHQAFLGQDRQALVQGSGEAVDVDEPIDLCIAEALLSVSQSPPSPLTKQKCGSAPEQFHGLEYQTMPPVRRIARVSIGDRIVGLGYPVYVVAEAGVNHDGSLDRALELVDVAARAGADAVKFQMFRASDLATADAPSATYQQQAGSTRREAVDQRSMLRRLQLPIEAFEKIRQRCVSRSIEFLATPFGCGDLERLLTLGVPAIKLASTDLNNTPLLRRAAAANLPLIVSTGASTAAEVAKCVEQLRSWGAGTRLILLHCVSCYPTPLEAANLRAIATLGRRFGVPGGLSDHTVSTQTGGWAAAAGACLIEKHFTLDRSAKGPDHAMSLDQKGLADYVSAVRQVEKALGSGMIGMTDRQREVRAVARKSVVTRCDIPAGTVLTTETLTVKRPGGGIEPGQLDLLIGRRAIPDLRSDTPLTWEMVEENVE